MKHLKPEEKRMSKKKDSANEEVLREQDANDGSPEDTTASEENEETLQEQQEAENNEALKSKEEEELQTRYLRLAADFQNYKRRVEKERNDIYAYANEKLMAELLNVIDNFDRALAVESIDAGMKEGMLMIFSQFKDVLEKSGLEEIPAEGEDFDPNCHHAVQTESSDVLHSGQIAKVLQKGYSLNKKVIRPSMVIVVE